MTTEKILKIIRGLNMFSLDDILMMCDVEETESENIIKKLISENKIIQVSENEYKYLKPTPGRGTIFQLVAKPNTIIPTNENILFKDAAEYFLVEHAFKKCRPATFKDYKSLIKTHLIQFFGKRFLKNITQEHIREFIVLKQKERLSNKRINNSVTLFGTMFAKFVEWSFVSESPYLGMINIKIEKKNNIKILNNDEKTRLLDSAKTDCPRLYLMILLILSTGIKKGEMLALQKSDIDYKNKEIHINKTLFEDKVIPIRVKTAIRKITVPENVFKKLKKLLEDKKDTDLIFDTEGLSHFTDSKKLRADFTKLIKKVGIEKISFNDLRHTYAFGTLQAGFGIDYLHKQLGDYSIQATMDRYRDFIG